MATDTNHAARAHALWSASSTARNWQCPGALALTMDLPETTNEAADWGTVTHEIAEMCLTEGKQADEFIGQTRKGKKFEFEVDEEMAETAQMFVDYVRQAVLDGTPPNKNPADYLWVEQNFSLESLNPPFEAGGTGDAVIYKPLLEEIEVVDLKGGRGVVVEVEGNPQLRTYGLGAMLSNPRLKVKTIKVTIVQPRAPHKNGRIRSETFHVADLVEWTGELLAAMNRSYIALREKRDEVGHTMSDTAWNAAYLNAGSHCKFCKAAGFCPALEKHAYEVAGIWLDDHDRPHLANDPNADDPAKIARDLDAIDLIEDWCKARRALAHEKAELGIEIPNYVLVPKQGREKWNDGVEEKVLEAARKAGLDDAKYLNPPKLKTPKQVRKALGAKNEALVAGLSSTPDAGTNLVRADKTTRTPVAAPATKFLEVFD